MNFNEDFNNGKFKNFEDILESIAQEHGSKNPDGEYEEEIEVSESLFRLMEEYAEEIEKCETKEEIIDSLLSFTEDLDMIRMKQVVIANLQESLDFVNKNLEYIKKIF